MPRDQYSYPVTRLLEDSDSAVFRGRTAEVTNSRTKGGIQMATFIVLSTMLAFLMLNLPMQMTVGLLRKSAVYGLNGQRPTLSVGP